MRLITSLAIIKTGKHIGFYKTSERQIVKSTESSSAYSNEVITYISKHKKTEYESLKIKLQEELRNIHERINDPKLLTIIKRLI